MLTKRTPRFEEESARHALRHACEDCAHFDAPTERCRHGWPTAEHRRARVEAPPRDGDVVVFCKEWELD